MTDTPLNTDALFRGDPLPWRKRHFLFLTLLILLLLPNGAVIHAQDLRYGDSFSATLARRGSGRDVNREFTFYGNAGDAIRVDVTSTGGGVNRLKVYITRGANAGGTLLAERTTGSPNSSSNSNSVSLTLQRTGMHRVGVLTEIPESGGRRSIRGRLTLTNPPRATNTPRPRSSSCSPATRLRGADAARNITGRFIEGESPAGSGDVVNWGAGPGEVVNIVAGPECVNGQYWYMGAGCVTNATGNVHCRQGWLPEGRGNTYYLAPASRPQATERPRCDLPPKLRVGGRAKNVSNSSNNIRNQASTSGRVVGRFPSGAVAEVLDGPRSANGYNWFKIRHSGVTGWTVEGGDCLYWLVNTTDRVSSGGNPSSPGRSDLGGTGSISYGQTRTGWLDDGNFFDDYRFNASADDIVTITMDDLDSDGFTHVRLYNSSATLLASSVYGQIERFRIPRSGTYFIHAMRLSEGQRFNYSLILTRESRATATRRATATPRPTDTPWPIKRISYGQSRTGSLSSSDEFHVYEFDGKRGDEFTVTMDKTSGNLDPELRLGCCPNRESLDLDWDSGPGNGALIRFTITIENKYYILAGRTSGTGNYRLTLSLANPTATPTRRPTSTPTRRPTATPTATDTPAPQNIQIRYGQEYVGSLQSSDDYITHQFRAAAGDIVTIRLDGEEDLLDLALDLWDSSGVKVASAAGSGFGASANIVDQALESGGDYYVSVIRQGGAGKYWLQVMLQAETDSNAPQVSQPQGGAADVKTHYESDPGELGIDGIDSDLLVDTYEIQPGDGSRKLRSAVKVCFPKGLTSQIIERGYLMFLDESRTPPKLGALISWHEGDNLCAAVDKPGTILRMNHNSEAAFNQWIANLKTTLKRSAMTLAARKTVQTFTEALIDVVGGQLAKKAGDAATPAFTKMKQKIVKKLGADSFNSMSKGSLKKLYGEATEEMVNRFRNLTRLNLSVEHYSAIYQANYDEIAKSLPSDEAARIAAQIADASIELMVQDAAQEYEEALLSQALDEVAKRAGDIAEEAGEEAINQTLIKFIFEDESDGGSLGDLVADQTEAIVGETASSVVGFLTDLGTAVALGIYSPLKSAVELAFHSITGMLADLGVTSWLVGADCRATSSANTRVFSVPNGIPLDSVPQNVSLAVSRRTANWFLVTFANDLQLWIKADSVSAAGAC